ncbi:malectin domain-containing carbohydrate-binding protein [Pontibacter liquoris]|uniref:malectin domain-containing carbohydrate-binding protein n=1 Tax=Pontibacter liquoris TaxID=2905677 RepID=UPI001FA756CE|nr:malectin domain-containing carbohydrate-binding protein [Pontibacter liquoris]
MSIQLFSLAFASPALAAKRSVSAARFATTTLVSNVSATSGRSYKIADLAVGALPYTDRTYTITSVPSSFAGATLVQTANDDKKSTSSALLTFDLSETATIYVAYDPRGTALPSWLSGWTKLADKIGINDSKISAMNLYSKSFAAGKVTLGGNLASPAAGAENNYFVVAKPAPVAAATLISNVAATSGKSYKVADLAVGALMYTDRTYKITSVPSTLTGATLIQTANDDKKSTSTSLLSFDLSEAATVYVAYDPRATALPTWLSGWTKLADQLGVEDSQISAMNLYSKSFAAGKVTLGGNLASPAAGAQTNYLVVAKQSTTTPPPTSQDVMVNFQLSTSATPTGYLADIGKSFDTSRGYGWIDASTKQPKDMTSGMRERSGTTDVRLRTLAQMQDTKIGQSIWEYAVPNGYYSVAVSAGDLSYLDSKHQVNVEGVAAISGFVPTSSEKFRSGSVIVEVTDGKLTIDANGGTNTKLNYALISPSSAAGDVTPPVVSVKFTGTQQSAGVYRDEVQVSVEASDNGGSGLASVQYSLNGGSYTTYSSPIKISTIGNYTVRARATDGSGNVTTTDTYNFSVAEGTTTNTYMFVENYDKFPGLDEMTFSLIQTPWRRLKDDGTYTPYNSNHNQVKLRIHNKGKGTLVLSNLVLSNSSAWKIVSLNSTDYNASSSLPVSVSSGTYAEAVVEFIAKDAATRVKVLTDTLSIYSNDDFAPYKKVVLRGLWQKAGEGNSEPYAQEIINAFGFKTKTGFNHDDGTIDGETIVPNSDEILSSFFVRVDPSKPVDVKQMAAYHNCCSNTERFQWYDKGSTTLVTLFTHNSLDGQSLLPRKSGSTTALAQGTFSPSGSFGMKVGSAYSDRTRNSEGKIGMRIWKARDNKGNIIPNAYIIGGDYLGTSYTNYDYQDNIYYISNVKPADGPAYTSELAAAPSDVDFAGVLLGSSKTLSVKLSNLGQTYVSGSDPAIQIKSIELAGPDANEFSATMPATTSLAVQTSTTMSVKFTPKSLGIKNAAVLVYYDNAASPLRIPLYGIANDNSTTISAIKRIKGAADNSVTIGGKVWEADIDYRKGSIKLDAQVVKTPIAATDDDVLYQTYLSAATDLAETRYDIPLPNGNYMVRVHFVENFFSSTGARVFNTTIENSLRLANFDIYREVGYRAALVHDFDVSVTDGVLNFKFNPTANRVAVAAVEIFKASAASALATSQSQLMTQESGFDANGRSLRLYPNPNTGDKVMAELHGFGPHEMVSISMHDVSGRQVQVRSIETDANGVATIEMPITGNIQRGIYLLKATSASGQAQGKLIVAH